MKVTLVNPPQTFPSKRYAPLEPRLHTPIGLIQIAAVLEEYGHGVEIIDSLMSSDKVFWRVGDEIHFGASWSDLQRKMSASKPDMVGIGNPFTSQLRNAITVARLAKEIDPEMPVVVGGPHASVRPEDFLKEDAVDVVVMGEGEYTLLRVIEHFEGKRRLGDVPGIAYKNNGNFIRNKRPDIIKNLDKLPLPAYHLLDLERYFLFHKVGIKQRPYVHSSRAISIITSRGCPFNCCFCSIHLHMGRIWRANSVAYVLEHLRVLKDKYRVEHISFEDDNISLNRKRFSKILDGMIENKFDFTWDTPNGIRADTLNEALIRKSKRAGCIRMVIAPESGDQDTVDNIIGKHLDLNKVVEVARLCKKYKIPLHAFYVIGFPGETKEKIRKTLNFAAMLMNKFDVIPAFMMANPLFGTRLYEECKEKGYLTKDISPEDIMLGSIVGAEGLIKTPDFTPKYLKKVLQKFYRKALLKNFLKPRYVIEKFIKDPQRSLERAIKLFRLSKG